ncbi:hypothetical protein B0H14DRAFT_3675428, partial [Mycena olivaceomarginata]
MALPSPATSLLDAFRLHYNRFQDAFTAIIQTPTDAVVIARLGDDLDEYIQLVEQNTGIFEPLELQTIQTSLVAMQTDVWLEYRDAIDPSHNGRPTVVQTIATGTVGRPRIHIDPDFLHWTYSQRSTASIHRFLGVSRNTVRTALLENGFSTPQSNPFPNNTPPDPLIHTSAILLYISFGNSTISGLIRWGIVIHGFIDGYSRLITGLRASDNNRVQTVLDVFLAA